MEAEVLAAKASFISGGAVILFSEKAWWPVSYALFALVTWTLSGWMVAFMARKIVSRIRSWA
jgi:hypothetical protein